MRAAQSSNDVLVPLLGEDRLEPELDHPLLLPHLTDRRIRSGEPPERARPVRVPGAALVVADPPGARLEEGVAHLLERLGRHEDDELAIHRDAGRSALSICARWSLPE